MNWLSIFIKGFLMGAANVIPGVSGGTIAFITGIYQRLLDALKSFKPTNLKLLFKGQLGDFVKATDLLFLITLGLGVVISIKTLAKALDYAFEHHPTLVWSLFFGLILASIWTVGKMVKKWDQKSIVAGLIGLIIAVAISFMTPASENTNVFYLMLCGVASVCSMIIPGLSGSFVLLLMGNYHLIMLDSINLLSEGQFGEAAKVLVPVGIGAVIGVVSLANFLSWLFKAHHDTAVSLITGFVAGSIVMVWPWKVADKIARIDKGDEIKEKVLSYRYEMPDLTALDTWLALAAMGIGALLVLGTEKFSNK